MHHRGWLSPPQLNRDIACRGGPLLLVLFSRPFAARRPRLASSLRSPLRARARRAERRTGRQTRQEDEEERTTAGAAPSLHPRAGGAAKYRSEAGRIRKLMRLVESPAMSNARSKAAAYALPDALPGLTWADIPIANVTPLPQGGRSSSQRPFRRLPDLLIPSIPPNANVGHQGQIVYWAAQCIVPEHGHQAVTEADEPATRAARAPCGRTVLLPDRWLMSRSNTWAREAVRGVSAPVLDRRAWLPAPTTTGRTPSATGSRTRSTGDGRETAYVGSFLLSPSNFGHPTTLPEEWFADSDSAAQMRSRLATVHNEALHQLRCRVPLCVTILRRPPPRRLIHEGTIADVLRTDFGRHAEVRIESFDGRKFAEQFGVMARTHVLVAPHGVRP